MSPCHLCHLFNNITLFPSPPLPSPVVATLQECVANRGSTDLWRPLHSLSLLVPTQGGSGPVGVADTSTLPPRNVFVITDGHMTEEAPTLAAIRSNVKSTRVFTFGVG